jgi:hypothetical protein
LAQAFEGTWSTISGSPEAAGQPATTRRAVMESRAVGTGWIVNEFSGEVAETGFQAVQMIGQDFEKKQSSGTGIDALVSCRWHYSGSLKATGKKVTLEGMAGLDEPDKEQARSRFL